MKAITTLALFLACSNEFSSTTTTTTTAQQQQQRQQQATNHYRFALLGKDKSNPFFDVVHTGCEEKARELSITNTDGFTVNCTYYGTESEDANEQAQLVESLIDGGEVDAISLSVIQPDTVQTVIKKAKDSNIPLITFDSDASNSERIVYIGTNNEMMGHELGKLLQQIAPEGGTYGVIYADATNVKLRAGGVNRYLRNTRWREAASSPKSCEDRIDLALDRMREFGADPAITAIITVGGWPMWNATGWKEFVLAHKHIQLISGDALFSQFELVNHGYAHALVGQLPYLMGEQSAEVLWEIKRGRFDHANGTIFTTAFLEILRVPLELPPLDVDQNHLGNVVWLGYVYLGIVLLSSMGFAVWTFLHRKRRVVAASQPFFLNMLCVGSLIMGSAIFPLTFDDERYSDTANDRACMSVPWLAFVGFTTVFASLFSKLWRVNKIFNNPKKFKRVVVRSQDVLLPYIILLGANVVVLVAWTVFAPISYHRRSHQGTDPWNRVLSTYGACYSPSDHASRYLIALACINVSALILAIYQAIRARSVTTEYSESHYIAAIITGFLQSFIVGLPIVFLVQEQPKTYFMIVSTLIFLTTMSTLIFIFVPKIIFLHRSLFELRRSRAGSDAKESGLRVQIAQSPTQTFLEGRQRVHVTGIDNTITSMPAASTTTNLKATTRTIASHEPAQSQSNNNDNNDDKNDNDSGGTEATSGDSQKVPPGEVENAPENNVKTESGLSYVVSRKRLITDPETDGNME